MAEALKYARILRAVCETTWAIQPQRLADILDVLAFKAAGGELSADEIRQYIGVDDKRAGPRSAEAAGGIAVLSLRGIISHRIEQVQNISGPGGTSVEGFRRRFREALASADVSGIVVDVDSPGGSVEGVPELAAEIREARGKKPMIAVANTLAASAAYWIGSAFDELSATASGEVGSVGVWTAHDDFSEALAAEGIKRTYIHAGKYKVEANPYAPLSDEARAFLQKRVDEVYGEFVAGLASNRGVAQKRVREEYGEGRVFGAQEALSRGMVDRIETLEQAIERMRSGSVKRRRRRAALFALATS